MDQWQKGLRFVTHDRSFVSLSETIIPLLTTEIQEADFRGEI